MARYSSTQINLPAPIAEDVILWGSTRIADQDIHSYSLGREIEPHVTILYNLAEANAQNIRYMILHEPPFEVRMGNVGVFRNEHFDVIKIDIDCVPLHQLHEIMKDRFASRKPTPPYSPHVTIAYVRKGCGDRHQGDDSFSGKSFHARQVAFYPRDGGTSLLSLRGRTR